MVTTVAARLGHYLGDTGADRRRRVQASPPHRRGSSPRRDAALPERPSETGLGQRTGPKAASFRSCHGRNAHPPGMSRPSRDTPAGRAYLDLRARARGEGRPTDELFVLYVLERFLFRLSLSEHHQRFVLKGGGSIRRPDPDRGCHNWALAPFPRGVGGRVAVLPPATG